MMYGVSKGLEEEANRIIRESLRGVHSHTAKKDILTSWKETDRRRREIPRANVDPTVRQGMFHRAQGFPRLNSMDGPASVRPTRTSSLEKFLEDNAGLGEE